VDVRKTGSGEVFVNQAQVITADIDASNGVVHTIDSVLIPPAVRTPSKNIVELALATPDLSTLVTALKAGNLVGTLSGKGPFTVFAPTNEAFAKLPKSTLDHLLDPKNIKELDAVLEYHVISGAAVHKADLKSDQKVKTLEGQDVDVRKTGSGAVLVNQAQVVTADVDASNGVVHIIDGVLLPPTTSAATFLV
jgi:transforming growth factor-beta-induced protein